MSHFASLPLSPALPESEVPNKLSHNRCKRGAANTSYYSLVLPHHHLPGSILIRQQLLVHRLHAKQLVSSYSPQCIITYFAVAGPSLLSPSSLQHPHPLRRIFQPRPTGSHLHQSVFLNIVVLSAVLLTKQLTHSSLRHSSYPLTLHSLISFSTIPFVASFFQAPLSIPTIQTSFCPYHGYRS